VMNQSRVIPMWYNSGFILKMDILKEYPFYATNIGGFNKNFKKGLEDNRNIIRSKGKLKRMPNLNPLKKEINKYMKSLAVIAGNPNIVAFMHSHEILLNRRISLIKYCVCVILNTKRRNLKIEMLAKKLKISVKYVKDDYGINNLIDLIENK